MTNVPTEVTMVTPDEMKWAAAPPTLPAGVKVAVIEGDPREVGPFTMRLLFLAGTRVEPHFHPEIEHATVLSGVVSFGTGRAFVTDNLRRMPVGSFIVIPRERRTKPRTSNRSTKSAP